MPTRYAKAETILDDSQIESILGIYYAHSLCMGGFNARAEILLRLKKWEPSIVKRVGDVDIEHLADQIIGACHKVWQSQARVQLMDKEELSQEQLDLAVMLALVIRFGNLKRGSN